MHEIASRRRESVQAYKFLLLLSRGLVLWSRRRCIFVPIQDVEFKPHVPNRIAL